MGSGGLCVGRACLALCVVQFHHVQIWQVSLSILSYDIYQRKFPCLQKLHSTTTRSWHDDHSISTKFQWGGAVRTRIQVFRMEFHTYTLKLGQSRISILYQKKKKIAFQSNFMGLLFTMNSFKRSSTFYAPKEN